MQSHARFSRWGRAVALRGLTFRLATLALLLGASGARGQPGPVPVAPTRLVDSIEIEGNHRTPVERVLPYLPFRAGGPVTQAELLAGGRTLERHLFRSAQVRTRAGSAPGSIVVTYVVEERRPHFRIGAGYDDLSGWYLIPLQLNLDNLTGHAEALRLSARLGYRLAGIVADLRLPGAAERATWGAARLRSESVNRIYFLDEEEIAHQVQRGGLEVEGGVRLHDAWRIAGTLASENIDATANPEYYRNDSPRERKKGTPVPLDSLPDDIRAFMVERTQVRGGIGLSLDSRGGRELNRRGLWGVARAEWVEAKEWSFPAGELDLRAYFPLGAGMQLAGRVHAAARGGEAPFFERLYLGGLYTVRGYPNQSLSPPEGDLNLATASLELRSRWVGSDENPRVVGLAFVDLGASWSEGKPVRSDGVASMGYGFRVRLPWVRYVGIDVGVPLSAAPAAEAFRVDGSLGWTF